MIVIVNIEIAGRIDPLLSEPGPVVHSRGMGFGGVAYHQFGMVESEVGTKPAIKVVQLMDLGRRFDARCILTSLKVGLANQASRVAGIGKTVGDRWSIFLRKRSAYMKTTVLGGVLAGDDRTPGWRTYRVYRVGPFKEDSTVCETVEVRCVNLRAQPTQAVPPLLVARNKKDVHSWKG